MGIDGMNSAEIFDEYFDNEKPKYVIKNCPAITTGWHDSDYICNTHKMGCEHCKDCTNCVMKQIVELCKERSSKCERCKANEDYQPTDCLHCSNDDVVFANATLQLLDIQEVE